jgi:hypothetical protein
MGSEQRSIPMYEYPPMLVRIIHQERLPRALRSERVHEVDRTNMAPQWTIAATYRCRQAVAKGLMAMATRIAPTIAAPQPRSPELAP